MTCSPGICQSIAFSPDGQIHCEWQRPQTSVVGDSHPSENLTHQETSALPQQCTSLKTAKQLSVLNNWKDTIARLDIETGERNVKKMKEMATRQTNSSLSYALTVDTFAVGRQDGKIDLGDTRTGGKLATLSGHTDGIQEGLPPAANEEIPPAGEIRVAVFRRDPQLRVSLSIFTGWHTARKRK